jgi:hypothetical protein
MALILKDRVKETTTTTSTGPVTLLGAADGYQSFAAIGDGNTTYYVITAQIGTEWEVGIGIYTSSGTTLSRDTVLSSSNGGSLVNFSAGTKDVFVTQPSGKAVYTDASNIINTSGNATTTVTFTQVNATNLNATTITATTVNATTGNFTNITGNAVALTDINASNITSGTISNARTTGDTANSANTIVLRDASGSFAANTITANVSGSGSGLTNINASNITSGTIGNAFTTANSSNGSSTIVLRDAGGAFAAGDITATSISGNGSALTAINASNIASGTLDNARTTASSSNGANTIVLRDGNGSFAANVGTFVTISGNGAGLTDINASNISSGTIANARTTGNTANSASTLVLRDASGNFSSNEISGEEVIATNGVFINNQTMGSSYSMPSGYSGMSTGPFTIGGGVTFTIPSGSRHVVL